MRPALFLIIIGLGGAAILISLGIWQMQRLAWKRGVIADIEARIDAPPVALPAAPTSENDAYLPVHVTGILGPDVLRVLVSQKDIGAGYRMISPLKTAAGTVLVDRGFMAVTSKRAQMPITEVTVTGNLQWPDETDGFTPTPDFENNIWFARDVPAMAELFGSKPVLVVANNMSFDAGGVVPMPVDTADIPNNHLQYAITWFSLAAIWLAMSFYFARVRARPSES